MNKRSTANALLILLLGSVLTAACSKVDESPEALMKAGVSALYTEQDPVAAVKIFRKVLAKDPDHFGASYQLAVALDRSGRVTEATPLWQKVLKTAEAYRNEDVASAARRRLSGRSDRVELSMKSGLDALYQKNDPEAAAVAFRKVLAENPSHYGAHLQLAKALDRAGKPAEARPIWEKVLTMAEGYQDATTAGTARTRLAQHP